LRYKLLYAEQNEDDEDSIDDFFEEIP